MERIERTFRGISARLARHYLSKLGGTIVDETTVEGPDWTATLSTETVEIGPSIELTEVTVVVEGDDETVPVLVESFARKAMRAGG
ncbi:hypothetical protein [Halapricum desulfuricans]|uniref:MoaD-like protein n=1 Tax=Halapricum desulfuricans TaxID=2841257 RepID=A0A897N0B4_9EURY|nr:hypothetical protein [Halapricum desulfuricans]QSG05698.1 MoaD-like protein [Halapricum desulfuricans]